MADKKADRVGADDRVRTTIEWATSARAEVHGEVARLTYVWGGVDVRCVDVEFEVRSEAKGFADAVAAGNRLAVLAFLDDHEVVEAVYHQ